MNIFKEGMRLYNIQLLDQTILFFTHFLHICFLQFLAPADALTLQGPIFDRAGPGPIFFVLHIFSTLDRYELTFDFQHIYFTNTLLLSSN